MTLHSLRRFTYSTISDQAGKNYAEEWLGHRVSQGGDQDNPVFHNHYVQLIEDPLCGSDPAVDLNTITFGSPGKLTVGGSNLVQSSLPKSFEGLTQTNTLIGPKVVSFELVAHFENDDPDDKLLAVCVTNIQEADKITER